MVLRMGVDECAALDRLSFFDETFHWSVRDDDVSGTLSRKGVEASLVGQKSSYRYRVYVPRSIGPVVSDVSVVASTGTGVWCAGKVLRSIKTTVGSDEAWRYEVVELYD